MTAPDRPNAFAEFWAAQGQAFLKAQQQAGKAFADGMKAMASGTLPAMPELSPDISTAAADLTRASQSMTALWSAAAALSGTLGRISPEGAAGGDATVAATFRNMVDPHKWMTGTGEMDEVLSRMAEGPRFADLWEIERRYARVLHAWMTVRRRGLEHNAVVLEAWLKAGRQFTEEFNGRTSKDGHPPDAKAALTLWTETANKQLLETQRSEPFLRTQAEMIRASTELRMAQRELVEHFGEQYGFPTRTEMDDVHRTVTELRRDLRALRREHRMAAAISAAPPAPAEHVSGAAERRPTAEHALAAEHRPAAERAPADRGPAAEHAPTDHDAPAAENASVGDRRAGVERPAGADRAAAAARRTAAKKRAAH